MEKDKSSQAAEKESPTSSTNEQQRQQKYAAIFLVLLCGAAALATGLGLGLGQKKDDKNEHADSLDWNEEAEATWDWRWGRPTFVRSTAVVSLATLPGDPLAATVPVFDPSTVAGQYENCTNLRDDLMQALSFYASHVIMQNADSGYFRPQTSHSSGSATDTLADTAVLDKSGEGASAPEGDTPPNSPTHDAKDGGEAEADSSGEDSFHTNNQVQGVDEADIFKSDGNFVYVAYGDQLVVWDAMDGTILSRTVMPTPTSTADDDNADCHNSKRSLLSVGYRPCHRPKPKATIADLLLHDDRLTVIVSVTNAHYYAFHYDPLSPFDASSDPILSDHASAHLRIYSTASLTATASDEMAPLPLLATRDLQGSYVQGRAIGSRAHLVTVSTVNVWQHIESPLQWWRDEYQDMDSPEDYIVAATAVAQDLIPKVADRLVQELDRLEGTDCSHIARLMAYAAVDPAHNETHLPSENAIRFLQQTPIFRTIAMVTSLDMDGDWRNATSANSFGETTTAVETVTSASFLPSWGTSNVYASQETLVLTANGYYWNERRWSSHANTFLLTFTLRKDAAAQQRSVGMVDGTLINQLAMDDYNDHLRLATTTPGSWGCRRFSDEPNDDSGGRGGLDGTPEVAVASSGGVRGRRRLHDDDDAHHRECVDWGRLFLTTNQVIVLDYGSEGNPIMKEVGRLNDLGKPNESIFAARFEGSRGFLVTFERTDPFYTLDLSNPEHPQAVGELEISGFSNYLHLIEDDQFVLAVGQEADSNGRVLGLQVTLFNVTNFTNPTLVGRHTMEENEHEWSWSDAAFDTHAWRYLEQSKRLILPVTLHGSNTEVVDGFMIFQIHVDGEGEAVEYRFTINHAERLQHNRCYSSAYLPSRSAVFDGKATTVKGHVAMSHDLETEEERWVIDLEEGKQDTTGEECYGWFH